MNVMVVILRPVGGPAVHGPNDTLEVLSQSFRTPRFYPDLCPLSAELLLEVEEFAAEGGVCSLPCYFFGLVFPTVDFPVHFLLVLVVIRERGMDLRERKMRMFTVYLFGPQPWASLSRTTSTTLVFAPIIHATPASSISMWDVTVVGIEGTPLPENTL